MKTKKLRKAITIIMAVLLLSMNTLPVLAANIGDVSDAIEMTETVQEVSEETEEIQENTEEIQENNEEDNTMVSDVTEEESVVVTNATEEGINANLINAKKNVQETVLAELDSAVAGEDYVIDEVINMCETEEEALQTAEDYHLTLESFQYGVATYSVNIEKTNVKEIVALGADTDNTLPIVCPNFKRELCSLEIVDPFLDTENKNYQWNHDQIDVKQAWLKNITGKGIRVAVVDSGINADHEEFNDSTRVITRDIGEGVNDEIGHGTGVAGIIGAAANGLGGRGVAPEVTIYSYKVANKYGVMQDSSILSALMAAIEDKAQVINMSFGSNSYSPLYIPIIETARNNGCVLVAAAGNEDNSGDFFPACYDGVINVSSIGPNDKKSSYSNYGSKIDICAPGGDLVYDNFDFFGPEVIDFSAPTNDVFELTEDGYVFVKENNSAYAGMCGTSAAAPIVSAAAALVLSVKPDYVDNPSVQVSDYVEEIIKSTARDLGNKEYYGAGCVDVAAAVGISVQPDIPIANFEDQSVLDEDEMIRFDCANFLVENIYYTTDGKTPTIQNGKLYTGSIPMPNEKTFTIKAIRVVGLQQSKVATYNYSLKGDELKDLVISTKDDGYGENIAVGQKVQLVCEQNPCTFVPTDCIWLTSDKNVAIVDEKGVMSALNAGVANIQADVYTKSGTPKSFSRKFSFTEPTQSILISTDTPGKYSYGVDTEVIFKADVYPSCASSDVYFSSSNPKVMQINEKSGKATALMPGNTSIIVTATDGTKVKASVDVNVYLTGNAADIIYGKNNSMITGKKYKPQVEWQGGLGAPTGQALKWIISSTDGSKYASINDKTGELTTFAASTIKKEFGENCFKEGISIGVHLVNASGNQVYGAATLKLYEGISTINCKEKQLEVYAYKYDHLYIENSYSVDVSPKSGHMLGSLAYSSSNPKVVQFDNEIPQMCQIIGNGTTTITIKTTDGSNKSTTVKLKVNLLPSVIGIINPHGSNALVPGKSIQFKTDIGEANLKDKIAWRVNCANPILATISNKGKLTIAKDIELEDPISVEVYAEIVSDKIVNPRLCCGFTTITVYPKTESIKLNAPTKMEVGGTYMLSDTFSGPGNKMSVEVTPANAYNRFTFSSSNPKVIKVLPSGFIEAVGKGTAKITAKAKDGTNKSGSIAIKVLCPVTHIRITSPNLTGVLLPGKSLQLKAQTNKDASNQKVQWNLSGDSYRYATITSNGKLTINSDVSGERSIKVTAVSISNPEITSKYSITTNQPTTKINCTFVDQENNLGAELSDDEYIMFIRPGCTQTISLSSLPDTAFQSSYSIKSSNPAVLKITDVNIESDIFSIKPLKEGSATLTITAGDGSGTKRVIKVSTAYYVSDMKTSIKGGLCGVGAGRSAQLNTDFYVEVDEGVEKVKPYRVSWQLRNPEDSQYLTVSSSGKIKADASNTSKRTISLIGEVKGCTATDVFTDITVFPKTCSVSLESVSKNAVIKVSETQLITPKCVGENNATGTGFCNKFLVTASNPSVVEISSSASGGYNIKGCKAGTTNITVTAADGSGVKAQYKLTVVNEVRSISIVSTTGKLYAAEGTKIQLNALVNKDATNKNVSWKVTDLENRTVDAAMINSNGLLTLNSVSKKMDLRITATAKDSSGISSSVKFTVYPRTGSLTLLDKDQKKSGTITMDQFSSLTVKATAAETEEVCYNKFTVLNSNQNVVKATYDAERGEISILPLKKGTATITVKTLDQTKLTATYKITVK